MIQATLSNAGHAISKHAGKHVIQGLTSLAEAERQLQSISIRGS